MIKPDEAQHDEHVHQLVHDVMNCLYVISLGTAILKGARDENGTFAGVCASMDKEQQEAIRLLKDLLSATCEGCDAYSATHPDSYGSPRGVTSQQTPPRPASQPPPQVLPCVPARAQAVDHDAEARAFPSPADPDELRRYAQSIVDEFGVRADEAGFDLGPAPTVEVRNTPALIYYSSREAKIGMPWWGDLPSNQRAIFTLFGGDEAEGEQIFRAFFYRFLVAHEAGHWFQSRTGSQQPTLYENEDAANRIAVAFWMTQPDGEAFLAELESMLAGIVDRVPDPTPPGEDPVAFFGANYRALAEDGVGYGYFQFRFMQAAIGDRHQLHLRDMAPAAPAQPEPPGGH